MARVVLKLGDDVSTDVIYPGRYMATILPSETPQYAFADEKAFHNQLIAGAIVPGDVIVAGNNFGCGSSREQAVSCLKGHDLVIVARSLSRIFLQNAINLGLRFYIVPEIEADFDDELEFSKTEVVNSRLNQRFTIEPLAPARQAILDAGGLIPYARHKLIERHIRESKTTILM